MSPSEVSSIPIRFLKGRKHVFVDWQFVEAGYGMPFWKYYQDTYGSRPWFSPYGVTLTVGQPEILSRPIIENDPLGYIGAYSTLRYEDGLYRLWYCTYDFDKDGQENDKICYAESRDFKQWHRPDLGLITYRGSRRNNIVYGAGTKKQGGDMGAHGATVFYDPSAPAESRYKMAYLGPAKKDSSLLNWLYGAVSPDGIHWSALSQAIGKFSSDTQTVALYDETIKKYVMYVRQWTPQTAAGFGGRRIVGRSESETFNKFPMPAPVLMPEPSWEPSLDIYTNAYNRWPEAEAAHIMLPALYHRNTDTVTLHLAVSRDARHWSMPKPAPILAENSSYRKVTTYAGAGIVPYGDGKWAFPVFFSRRAHNEYISERPAIHAAVVREDGFMAVESTLKGEFYTYPCIFEGSRLLLNSFSYSGGEIRVEIIELKPKFEIKPFDGFAIEDCGPVMGNSMWAPVTWKGTDDISALAGKIVRLRFLLIRSRIFAFRFE
ncbi:MAG: hypothetical protein L7F77_05105 [Candidatus Magnetominusculus sp. LBB02]|nr:hypothetical protein [Candidatus Magnetominusculus sp. LBB02]